MHGWERSGFGGAREWKMEKVPVCVCVCVCVRERGVIGVGKV